MAGIDNRKDLLLLLLYLPGPKGEICEPIRGRTRFMKLVYLLERELNASKRLGIPEGYAFEAYHYGPFSKQLYEDIDFLENVNLIASPSGGNASEAEKIEEEKIIDEISLGDEGEEYEAYVEEDIFRLTPHGKEFVENNLLDELNRTTELRERIIALKKEKGGLALSSLLRYVYSNFPEHASKSLLQHLLLR